jgi:hypothetical protein
MPRPQLELERHQVWLDLRVDGGDDLPAWRRKLAWLLEDVRHEGTTMLGFMFQRSPVPGYFAVSVPYWSFAAMTAVLPLLWTLRRLRARSASSSNSCASCGDDLRATPHRCPECGATPAEETT